MVKFRAHELDEWFFIGVVLIFLMINYNLPLSSIYNQIMIYIILMYVTPFLFKFFNWIPVFAPKGKNLVPIIVGAGMGMLFIFFYNSLVNASNIAQVFATTAFGDSVFIGKVVFGIIIPIIETVFFFRILLQWTMFLINWDWRRVDALSGQGLVMSVGMAAVFTFFHATAKGVTNNIDLIATFAFGVVSVMLVLYFKRVIEGIIMHVVVNSHSVGLMDTLTMAGTTAPIYIGIGVVVFLFRKQIMKVFS